ncbi:MAG TPA: GNAT family N-acetyltransferase [Gemmatimonadaceae bacterium]|nr:GNAT family N-acetyltransferase [Gemmatimonadaceae bacterium]
MTGYFDAARSLTRSDAEAVRSLVLGILGITPYVDRVLELADASDGSDREHHGLLMERDGTAAALALFGPVAGADRLWHLGMFLVAPRVDVREIGGALLDAVVSFVRDRHARVLMAELPADPVIGSSLSLLRGKGFKQEARIPDFYRDGVALLFLRMNL